MKFPAYWAKATAEEATPRGRNYFIKRWRSSEVSQEDAYSRALAAAKKALRGLMSDEGFDIYGFYERSPVREEVKQEFTAEDGTTFAVITQNAYGSLVLNTARVMFVDIDLPAISAGQNLSHFFKSLVGRAGRAPQEVAEDATYDAVLAFARENRPWSGRLYRTHSGFRLLATHALFEPDSEATRAVFDSLAADRLYVRMCQVQQCFRARLTPKPWRCGQRERFPRWPRLDDEEQQRYEEWEAEYVECQRPFATCRYVETVGEGPVHPEARQIVDIHDQLTRASESLGLA